VPMATTQPVVEWFDPTLRVVTLIIAAAGVAATWTGVCIAAKGLKTWRRQLHGHFDFEIARRISKATLMIRDTMQYARIALYEGNTDQLLKQHIEAMTEFGSAVLEVEIRWGEPIVQAAKNIRMVAAEFWVAVTSLRDLRKELQGRQPGPSDNAELHRLNRIVHGPEDSEITQKLKSAVEEIIRVVRPHLEANERR
jgi:hypothetical protein